MTPFKGMVCTSILVALVALLGTWGSAVAEVWKVMAGDAVSPGRVLYLKQRYFAWYFVLDIYCSSSTFRIRTRVNAWGNS
jgi:hypothetical protein